MVLDLWMDGCVDGKGEKPNSAYLNVTECL